MKRSLFNSDSGNAACPAAFKKPTRGRLYQQDPLIVGALSSNDLSAAAFRICILCLLAFLLNSCAGSEFRIPTKQSSLDADSPQWISQSDWLEFQRDGEFLLAVQRFDKAEEAFLTAVKKAEAFGARDARVARSKTGLARTYVGRRNWPRAASEFRDALAIKQKSYGRTHYDVGEITTELAFVQISQGETAEARKTIDEAKSIWQQTKITAPAELVMIDAIADANEGKDKSAEQKFKLASDLFLAQIDLHKFPQPIKSMRNARECIDRYAAWLEAHKNLQLAKSYRAKGQPISEWLMILGESGV